MNQVANFEETGRNIAERAAVSISLAQITNASTRKHFRYPNPKLVRG